MISARQIQFSGLATVMLAQLQPPITCILSVAGYTSQWNNSKPHAQIVMWQQFNMVESTASRTATNAAQGQCHSMTAVRMKIGERLGGMLVNSSSCSESSQSK